MIEDIEDKSSDPVGDVLQNDPEVNVMNEITLQVIGQMSNIPNLNSNSLKPLIMGINNVAKKLTFSTMHVTKKSNRCVASVYDALHALKLEKITVPHTINPSKLIPLKQTKSSNDVQLYYPDDTEVDLREYIGKEPSKVSFEPTLSEHWLSIYSVQPATPENPSPTYIHTQKKILREKVYGKMSKSHQYQMANKDNLGTVLNGGNFKSNSVRGSLNGIALGFNGDRMPAKVIDIRPHFVGTEHQVYFKTLTEACVGNDENARNNALVTIKNDKALDPLMPHLMQFIAEGIRLNIIYQNLAVLIYLVRIVRSLVDNHNVNMDPYLYRIIPALLSVVLCGNICLNPITDNHFALRKFAGKVVNGICERQHTARNELISRLCTTLMSNITQITSPNDKRNFPLMPLTEQDSLGNPQTINSNTNSNNSSQDFTMRLNTLCGSVLVLSEFSQETIRHCLIPLISEICKFMTQIVNLKGSTLLGAEDKALRFLKDILLSEKVLKVSYEYRISNNKDIGQEACIKDYGSCLGMKFFEYFAKSVESQKNNQQQSNAQRVMSLNSSLNQTHFTSAQI